MTSAGRPLERPSRVVRVDSSRVEERFVALSTMAWKCATRSSIMVLICEEEGTCCTSLSMRRSSAPTAFITACRCSPA